MGLTSALLAVSLRCSMLVMFLSAFEGGMMGMIYYRFGDDNTREDHTHFYWMLDLVDRISLYASLTVFVLLHVRYGYYMLFPESDKHNRMNLDRGGLDEMASLRQVAFYETQSSSVKRQSAKKPAKELVRKRSRLLRNVLRVAPARDRVPDPTCIRVAPSSSS
eukprot:6351427-Prymnesium_polylepis.2